MRKDPVKAIIMATFLEAKAFLGRLGLKEVRRNPFPLFTNASMLLTVSGIGKANAAMAAALCCHEFKPGCICNLGAAGAVADDVALGESYQAAGIYELDRPGIKTGVIHRYTSDILEGFCNAKLGTSDKAVLRREERRLVSGTVDMVDMEGAAVLRACRKFNTRCHVFKFISDTPDHTEGEEIVANIRRYRTAFFDFFYDSLLPALDEASA